jgi:hypothetical protein
MPTEQTLTPDDLSSMQILTVPDVWPPVDWPPAVGLPCQPAGFADSDSDSDSDSGGVRLDEPADGGQAWPRQFAVLLAEALTGARPVRQILPWLSQRGTVHLRRLLPLFSGGQGARVQRIMTTQPSPDVIEMTLIVAVGPRTRALAVRLARAEPTPPPQWRGKLPAPTTEPRSAASPRWLCTDIEAA